MQFFLAQSWPSEDQFVVWINAQLDYQPVYFFFGGRRTRTLRVCLGTFEFLVFASWEMNTIFQLRDDSPHWILAQEYTTTSKFSSEVKKHLKI